MRILAVIVFFFLVNLNGCVSYSALSEIECQNMERAVLIDEMESNLMNLYTTAADTRHAVQQESTVCLIGFSVRVLTNRTRTVSNVNIRQVLLSTHKPVISRFIHCSATQLVAFPKEYHVFWLRRILI